MSINAQQVKELRDKSGVGMMDCKKALVESNGDIDKAFDILRKSGIAKAKKKSGRDAKEGLIFSYHKGFLTIKNLGVLHGDKIYKEIFSSCDFVSFTKNYD